MPQPGILKDIPEPRKHKFNIIQEAESTFKTPSWNLKYKKMEAVAKLKDYPTSPRKMRLLADVIRGMGVEKALALLEFHPQHNAVPLAKLLKSAINNWEQKNNGESAADASLVVKTVFVDGGRILKRMRPAPQGRGYKIRKRSNHVTIIVDSNNNKTI